MKLLETKDYIVPASSETPFVRISKKQKLVEIRGKSLAKTSKEFYCSLESKVKELECSSCDIEVELFIEYFNTPSSKGCFNLLRTLELMQKVGTRTSVKWYVEADDWDMREIGEDYRSLLSLQNFQIIEVEENPDDMFAIA